MTWNNVLKWAFWLAVVGCLIFGSIGVYVAIWGV